jgi:hypothetical protein
MAQRFPIPDGDDAPPRLTVAEAARFLRVTRSLGYEMANVYLATGGLDGLPVIRFGSCLRVPRWALVELATTGNVVLLGPGASSTPKVRRAS